MANERPANIALLIDGDNVSPKIIAGLMNEIANYGTASVRRIYGDWTNPSLKGWKACLLDYSITPIQQFAYTNHKNSTDGAMIIDAMDLLYTNRFSIFCLVSSDSDFTRLAARIREQAVTVYGFGERKTPSAFISACNKFVYFDVLDVPIPDPSEASSTSSTFISRDTGTTSTPIRPHTFDHAESMKKPIDKAALEGLAKAIRNNVGFEGEYANLANVGHYLNMISPSLNARNYGYDRLRDFVEASGIASLKWKAMGDNPPIVLVRLKNATDRDNPRRSFGTVAADGGWSSVLTQNQKNATFRDTPRSTWSEG